MSSRPEVTPGTLESSGDRNAGIAMCRTPIGRQRCYGSERTWVRVKLYGPCALRREIGTRIDAGPGANLWVSHWNALLVAPEGAECNDPQPKFGKGRTDRSARVPEHTDEWAISPARNWAFFELIRQMTRGQ